MGSVLELFCYCLSLINRWLKDSGRMGSKKKDGRMIAIHRKIFPSKLLLTSFCHSFVIRLLSFCDPVLPMSFCNPFPIRSWFSPLSIIKCQHRIWYIVLLFSYYEVLKPLPYIWNILDFFKLYNLHIWKRSNINISLLTCSPMVKLDV